MKILLLLALLLSACVPATGENDDPAGPDAGLLEVDDDNGPPQGIRPLDSCGPLINQHLIPWAETMASGTCAKLQCPEGNGTWSLMVCNKAGTGEVYWEIDQ